MPKIGSIFMLVFTVLLLKLVFYNPIFAQNTNPRLYPVSDEKCLIAWQSDNKPKAFTAQFVLSNTDLNGINFPVYSNELISFNSLTDFMVTKTYDYPGNDYFTDSFSVYAKIYHSILDTTNTFFLTHNYWPFCGMDFLGFEEILVGLEQNFLYVNQFNGYLTSQIFNVSGERISSIFGTTNACHITVDGLPDGSYLIVWFSGRSDEFSNLLPYGIYATFIDNNQIRADSILIKEYPHFPEYVIDSNHNLIPTFRIKALNDTAYKLFVIEPDSLYLYSYLLNREAEIKKEERYPIPKVYHYSSSVIPYVRALNISNFAETNRVLFLSTFVYDNLDRYVINYLYYFTDLGSFLSGPVIDTTQIFKTDYFQFKTGPETFLNPSESGNDIMIDTYNNFSLIGSQKIGEVSSIDKKNDSKPRQFYLSQNFPNPFNSQTIIPFEIDTNDNIKLTIYDINGRTIKKLFNGFLKAGKDEVIWMGDDDFGQPVSSGLYFCLLKRNTASHIIKLVLLR
jgi:hypothetical protein